MQIAVGIDTRKAVLLVNDSCGHGDKSETVGTLLKAVLCWLIKHMPGAAKVRTLTHGFIA